jgi:hypothetical protein
MSTTSDPHDPTDTELHEHEYEDDGFSESLPVRSKRPFLTKWSAGLMALTLAAIGFWVGVDVEKGKTTTGGTSALASAALGTGSKTGRPTGSATGGPGGFSGAAPGGTSGTVSSVDGDTIYLKDSAGNTVKVKLASGTTITKSEKVANRKVYPGDEVVVAGKTASDGNVSATSVTDSGSSGTSTTATSS